MSGTLSNQAQVPSTSDLISQLLAQIHREDNSQGIAVIRQAPGANVPVAYHGELFAFDTFNTLSTEEPLAIREDAASNRILYRFLLRDDQEKAFLLVQKFPKKFLPKRPDVNPSWLVRLRQLVVDYCIEQARSEADLVVRSISELLASQPNSHPFKHVLGALVRLSECSAGSLWEYHDNSAHEDSPYLTVEATENYGWDQYDEDCLPFGEGIVWQALAKGTPKVQYFTHIDQDKVINKRLDARYENQPLALMRLETKKGLYGVACLKRPNPDKLHAISATLETFEKIAALAITNKHLQLKAEALDRLQHIVPRPSPQETIPAVCQRAVEDVRTLLNCQAVSLFLRKDFDANALHAYLMAVAYDGALTPSKETNQFKAGAPVYYHVNVRSHTSKILRSSRPVLRNRVSKSEENSRLYREIADTSNDTWLGVPILNSHGLCIGVLRCTGKQVARAGNIRPYIFDTDDIQILNHFAVILSRVLETIGHANSLHNMNRNLALAEEIRGHEMNAPLTSIAANARFIRRYINDTGITSKSRRLGDIMLDAEMCCFLLRETNLPSHDEMKREGTEVSIHKVLTKMKDFLIRRVESRSDRVQHPDDVDAIDPRFEIIPLMHVELTGHAPPVIAHPLMLQRAFYNVAWNAIKYGKPGGHLKIKTFSDSRENAVYIDFEDDGIGIEPKELNKIFQKGFRGSNAPSEKYPGSGLGLHITSAILALHGGTIEVLSARNPTKFRITLPIPTTRSNSR